MLESYADQIFSLLVLSMIVASVSWTVTQEEIFKEWREHCEDNAETARQIVTRKFFYVFTCEYCFSHWVTIAVLIFSGFRLMFDDWRGYVTAFFVMPWIANQLMSLYQRLRADTKLENRLADIAEEKVKSAPPKRKSSSEPR
ncbi:MAG: hypothetical protein WKF34_09180 [Pyrinomonadaceae bacterium]